MSEDFDFEETDRTLKEIEARMNQREEKGIENTLKYFDRIHDHLFNFNNLLIAGYFALASLNKPVGMMNILFPLSNMAFLLFIEFRMLNKSRFEAEIKSKTPEEIESWGHGIQKTNQYSLFAIFSTAAVTIIFVILLFSL
jgi:hypothetical protein